jgi:hypothetical protein
MKLYRLAPIIVLLLAGAVSAQVGRTGVPFLLIAPGARAAGMGEAFISIADDATAVHWNPAGLGRYPLTGAWLTLKAGADDSIQAIVLLKNNLPENNYRQYDIWGINKGKLAKWNGIKWLDGSKQDLRQGVSMQSLIMRYTGLSEDAAAPYVDKLARANNQLAPESIDSLKDRLIAALPADYVYKEDIQYGFEKLHTYWLELRIDMDGFNLIKSDIANVLADSVISGDKLDKIAFGFERGRAPKGDRSIWLPYNLILPDTINCLAADDQDVYVGTNNGLFKLDTDKFRWSTFQSTSDSLPSGNITAIAKVGNKHTIFVGTDKGLTKFNGKVYTPFVANSGTPKGIIRSIASSGDQNVWVASDSELYHFDGLGWQNALEKEFSIGQKLNRSVEKFYGEIGSVELDKILAQVTAANPALSDTVQAGQAVKLPYNLGYKGEITTLSVDQKGKVWIGTTTGINYYDGESFHLFGYKLYEVTKPTTVQEIASQYIPDKNADKVAKLSLLIKEYNGLDSDQVDTGTKLLVYANALGSDIKAVAPVSGKKAIVATDQGIVEYDNGKWGRMHNLDMSGSDVNDIYSHSGELWVGSRNTTSIYASPKKQITFMHSNYLVQLASDIYYEYFSFVYPTNQWGTFGFGVTFLSLGNQQRTGEIGQALGAFYTYEMALTLSYGTKLMNNLYGGLSLRYINSHLSDVGAGQEKGSGVGYSVALDGGVIYDMTHRITLAATVTNLGPNISYIDADQADPLPRKLALGFDYKLIDSPFNRLSIIGEASKLLVDLNHGISTEIKEIIPHVGLEYWYSNYVSLRGGYVYDWAGKQKYFTLGASLQYTDYRFDFAYIPPSNENFNRLGNTIRFSMNVGF